MYRERAASGIAGAVLWESVSRGDAPTRVLPDGCLDLLWSSRAGLLVAGPDRTAHLSAGAPGECWVGLRLPPGVGPAVFGVPAHELRDRRVSLADLWGRPAGELADRIEEASSAAEAGRFRPAGQPTPLAAPGHLRASVGRGRVGPSAQLGRVASPAGFDHVAPVAVVLEAVAVARLRAAGGPDPLGARVAARLAAGATVAATAAEVGLGARALHRRSQALFGYGPKTLARIMRMRRALDLARAGTPLAEVAARAGYADQAHLTREVKDLAGVPPTHLLPGHRV
ncbi:helix-turn-helix transcriptional regulator [Micromonospora sp. DR5-3]|uniref:helix-turn-helix transcriptional regulator n=1 Tax=unclassified Micromonospora TaxID=2617518 RepID=UPI0011D4FDF6|nr:MULTISPECIES: helix-turn-helix transcriptional regulator [unclassified Micromonospora]MCW3818092.1 helix-turn-helix transcriptional regulator [Micromonospora sp. DR5-3]TYC22301.1 helix-turn-helix transcriptional regulator [Micromonospora sp. MP36]